VLLGFLVIAAAAAPAACEWMVEIEPFKTAITVGFDRAWPAVAYAVGLVLVGAVVYKFFCRFLCPLGAFMELGGQLCRRDWLARRPECGRPCQVCRNACAYDAIERDGSIDYRRCHQCLDCVAIHDDPKRCVPLIRMARGSGVPSNPARRPAPPTHE
jgi:polyferredoxin